MPDFFQFKQFTIHQDRCGMKVGTDGVLLGAWSKGGKHILDIGTGTGLIALMLAQRYPDAEITGVELDEQAALQDAVIVFDKQYHLIVGFVHLMIFHTNDYLFVIMWAITTCKVIKKKRNGQ